jgi:hypothetical protein
MGFAGEVKRADQEIRDGVLIPSAGWVGLEWSFSKNVTARFTGSTVNSRPSSRERELGIEATDFLDLSFQVRDGSPDWTEVDRTAS